MIQFAIYARGTVEYEFFIWTRISQRLVRLQFDMNSTMTSRYKYVCFSGKVLWRDWGSTRSGMPGLQHYVFDACGVEFHVTAKLSLPSLGILCFAITWEFNLDGIQFICIFDASVWISLDVIYLDELIPICKSVDGCLGKRGYGNTPVCAKPSYWMYLGRTEFSLEFMWNMRPMVNRFVLDKCRLWTNYDVWFSTFSGSLHVARSLQWMWMTVEYTFVKNNVFWKLVFGELRNFVWRWRSMGRYVECRFCLRMCMLDNKLQTFFNLVLFQQLCGRLWMFLQAAWKQLETTFLPSEMFMSNNVCMADFLHCFHWMISALEFDAPARCTST